MEYYKKIFNSTIKKFDNFFGGGQHSEDLLEFMVWREALDLNIKVMR